MVAAMMLLVNVFLSRAWIEGTLTVTDYSARAVVDDYGECRLTGDYFDIGVLVTIATVRDEAGGILGRGGVFGSERAGDYSCRFFFTVEVPKSSESYAIEIGGDYGEEVYRRSYLESNDWSVSLELGGS